MINIVIDLDQVVAEIHGNIVMATLAAQAALPAQISFIQSVWIESVSGRVLPGMSKKVTNERYAASIADPGSLQYPFNGDEFAGAVVCVDGDLAMRIEEGYASFDMKPGLLSGPASKVGKDGKRFNTIPFIHSTPTSLGQKGAPMPAEVYAQAKKLGQGVALRLKGTALQGLGIQTKQPVQVNAQALIRGLLGPMTAAYTWRSSPYEGMRKVHKTGHTTYITFRRVSENSDPNAWIHPGQEPNRVIEAVGDYVAPIVTENIMAAVREAIA